VWRRYRESNPGLEIENPPSFSSDLIRAAEFKAYHKEIRLSVLALKEGLEGRIGSAQRAAAAAVLPRRFDIGGLGVYRFELL